MSLIRPRTTSSEAFETTAMAVSGSDPSHARSDSTPEEIARWIGVELDHFTVQSPLGRGGMGAVYLGRDRSLDRLVAIKVLPESLADKPGLQERFVREARAQARLTSPHVVHIYYIGNARVPGATKASLFFAMEWVEGESLEPAPGAKMPADEARTLMLQVARGLRDAQNAGIIHRDIKPSNLLRDKRGYIKIADFGLAKPVDGDVKITQEGVMMGSPLYIAPEQARADAVDHRADMYALGCTFYHLVSGSPPFDGPSALAVVAKHLSAPVPSLVTRAPGTPPALAAVIERLMMKDATDRYATYDALIAALEASAPEATMYAGFWTRGAAALMDAMITMALVYFLGAIGLAIDVAYFTLAHAYFGQTAGKYLLSIKVVRTTGARLGLLRSMARTLASMWLPFLFGVTLLITGGVPLVKSFIDHLDPAELDQIRMVIVTVAASHIVLTLLYAAGLALAAFHPQKRAVHDLLVGSRVVYRLHRHVTGAMDAAEIARVLGLEPHPEGGFFRETFRAAGGASTAIYFLLPAGTFSAFHRFPRDEVWHHYDGDPVELHTIDDAGVHRVARLGRDLAAGERPQVVIPSGVWQAARPMGESYALCGCTVAPAFDFAELELPSREAMLRLFPSLRAVVEPLTRAVSHSTAST